ncbi:MAG: IS4 family transposase [Syntrophobacteraceae bacterium]
MGGFLGRKSDGEPGTIILWRGLQPLNPAVVRYRFLLPQLKHGP